MNGRHVIGMSECGMPGRVLVAEDDRQVGRLLMLILQREGIEADLVKDGREALDLLQSRPYSVVVCDLMMPVMNGYELINVLRQVTPRPAVIVVSAAGPGRYRKLDPEVVSLIMRKPFDVAEFAAVVSELVQSRPAVRISRARSGDVVDIRSGGRDR